MDMISALIVGLAMLIGYLIGKYSKRKKKDTSVIWKDNNLFIANTGEIVATIDMNGEIDGQWSVLFLDAYGYCRIPIEFINQQSAETYAEENYRMP